jgi:hypothetical protein
MSLLFDTFSSNMSMYSSRVRMLVIAAFFCLSALPLFLASHANADCVLGCRSCQGGFEYTCEKCGSETCWILSGGRCDYNGSRCMMKQAPPTQGFSIFSDIMATTPVNWNPTQAFGLQKY